MNRVLAIARMLMAVILTAGFVAPASICAALCVPSAPQIESGPGCCHKSSAPDCHQDSDGTGEGCTCHFDSKSVPAPPDVPLAPTLPLWGLSWVIGERPDHADGLSSQWRTPVAFGTDSGPPGGLPLLATASRAPPVIVA